MCLTLSSWHHFPAFANTPDHHPFHHVCIKKKTRDGSPLLLTARRKLKRKGTRIGGFKKHLFNQVMSRGHMLTPAFQRRKHGHSYGLVVNNHLVKLSKTFGYHSRSKIKFYIGLALKKANAQQKDPSAIKIRRRTVPYLASVVETDTSLMLTRNQQYFTFLESKQRVLHGRVLMSSHRHTQAWLTAQSMSKRTIVPELFGPWVDTGEVLYIG